MNKKPTFISDRISYVKHENKLTVVIAQEVTKKEELLLLGRVLGWMICGAVFVYYYFNAQESGMRQFMMITLAFWLFFFIRFARVYFWKKWGREYLMVEPNIVSLKSAYGSLGKATGYFLDNITEFGTIKQDKKGFVGFMQEGFLSTGGARLGFDYMGKHITFAKQLSEPETKQLFSLLVKSFKAYKGM